MARILPDHEIESLLGTVLKRADRRFLNPNGIELRLGGSVHFHSTGEEFELEEDEFLVIHPGESASICSLELIDFRGETVHRDRPTKTLMGFITPTTTMMREGLSQVSTKIDAGFCGCLNWSIRNNSTRDLIYKYGEPIFKLTIFELDENESPNVEYGTRPGDQYQNTEGIKRSKRQLPADIPKTKLISSSFDKIDPKKQLREAGYPFDHIGSELVALDGKFEVVSSNVRLLKEEFEKEADTLSRKIESETSILSKKIEDNYDRTLERVENLFDRKFLRIVGVLIGAGTMAYGFTTFLENAGIDGNRISLLSVVIGSTVVLISFLVGRKTH